ncbi:MAG: M23 family metallopeptidase [Deltaproteobacteria bacterium]|jgi:hypothetical protein|nr:M23 family metallopeptidase [Deltaproteobacteria bacterium]
MPLFRKSRRFKNVRTEQAGSLERLLFFFKDKAVGLKDLVLSLKYRTPLKNILKTSSPTTKESKTKLAPERDGYLTPSERLNWKHLLGILAFLVIVGTLLFIFIPGHEKKEALSVPVETELVPADSEQVKAQAELVPAETAFQETLAPMAPGPETDAVSGAQDEASMAAPPGGLTFQESPELPVGIFSYDASDLAARVEDSAVIKEGGSISQALDQLGIERGLASAALAVLDRERILPVVRPGAVVKAYFSSDERGEDSLLRLEFYQDKQLRPIVLIPGGPNGFIHYATSGRSLELYEASQVEVRSTFWSAAIESGLDPRVIMNLTDLLSSQIDFVGGVKSSDSFQLLFRARYEDGVLSDEPILEMVRVSYNDKPYEFFRQELRGGEIDFFDEHFRSIRKGFLVSPLQFTRISSGFTNARMHPILKVPRPHEGVDYAAPIGTPVSAVADGEVSFAGSMGGYGTTVVIDHKSYELVTMYGHLSRIEKGIKVGTQVSQGQLIGYVGTTGLSTGPHLDFRLKRETGEYLDPEKEFARLEGRELPPELQVSFAQSATARRERLRDLLKWSTF